MSKCDACGVEHQQIRLCANCPPSTPPHRETAHAFMRGKCCHPGCPCVEFKVFAVYAMDCEDKPEAPRADIVYDPRMAGY